MAKRKLLTDILRGNNSGGDWINDDWGGIAPAPEFGPIPPGKYVAHAVEGALFNAGTGTPGYKVTFAILEGEHQGRRVWYDIWLTQKAQSQAVRDFGKLCITSKTQLEQPLPQGIRCEIDVILRANDRAEKYNVVRSFRVIGIDPPEQDAFAPADPQEGGPTS